MACYGSHSASRTIPDPLNTLRTITWNTLTNASVNLVGVGQVSQGQRTTLPAGAQSVALLVTRVTPGVATTVQMIVTDGCGDWPTFAGGGPSAF